MTVKNKRYSLRQLHYLWIDWVNENDIPCQELFERYNLKGSFTYWLEHKELENSKINKL